MKTLSQLLKNLALVLVFGIAANGKSQTCTASFFQIGLGSGTYSFASNSTGTNTFTTYYWNFGNGSPTYSSTGFYGTNPPLTTFTANGTYTVSLSIFTPPSCSSTAVSTINVSNACSVSASFNHTLGANGLIQLQSTTPNAGASTSYYWTIVQLPAYNVVNTFSNSGAASNHSYAATANGTYSVQLRVFDPSCGGGSTYYGAILNISNVCNLNANFSASTGSGGTVVFSNLTTGANGSLTAYNWSFGNGGSANTATAISNYSVSGLYNVTLTATNSGSCTSTFTANVLACTPIASFTYAPGANGLVNFNSTSTGVNANTTYSWSLGNGGGIISGTNNVSTTYTANSNYTVLLIVHDTLTNCMSNQVQVISVNNVTTACNLNANFSVSTGTNGLYFFNSTSTGTNSGSSYTWNFGNGSNATGPASAAIYTANGSYLVTLTINNNTFPLCTNTFTQVLSVTSVTAPCNLTASFTYTMGINGQVNFISNSFGAQSGASYNWSFGNSQTGSGFSTSQIYTNNGNYVVTLVVNNNSVPTCTSSSTQTISISNACMLNANFSYTNGFNGQVNFLNTSTGTVNPVTYFWYFGNGQTSNLANPSITYTANGTYQVKLKVNNSSTTTPFCNDSLVQFVNVNNVMGPCNLTANFSHTVGSNGVVSFANLSTGANTLTTYFWSFGDGTSFNGANPAPHTYPSAGNYTVYLYASNGGTLCTNATTQAINVTGINCIANANFSLVPTMTAQVWNAIPAFPWNITQAVWSWGDGSSSTGLWSSHTYSAAGLYSVCLTVTVSCGSNTTTCFTYSVSKLNASNAMIHINVVPPELIEVGLTDFATALSGVNFYPNPNKGLLNLKIGYTNAENMEVLVIDLTGKKIFETELDGMIDQHQIDLQALPNGLYMVQLQQAGQRLNKKLIITKD